MIEESKKTIAENFGESFSLKEKKLYFLKYNTPISGMGLGNKVLFFVFKEKEEVPIIVVKTIRTKRDEEVIKRGYERLRNLNEITKNTDFSLMFPQALTIEGNGDFIWSAETFITGQKGDLKKDLEKILKNYTLFSKYIKSKNTQELTLDREYCLNLIREFTGEESVIENLKKYSINLWGEEKIKIPKVPQHGDLTIDNIIFEGEVVKIVDCDNFGNIKVPGYDIFHLLSRQNNPTFLKETLADYFQDLKIQVPIDKKILHVYFLHELFIKKDYILRGKSAEAIIEEFEAVI